MFNVSAELERLKKTKAELEASFQEADAARDALNHEQTEDAREELDEARREHQEELNSLGGMDEDDYRLHVAQLEENLDEIHLHNPLTRPAVLEQHIAEIEKEIEDLSS